MPMELHEWLEQCPLLKYKEDNQLTYLELGAAIGVSTQTLQKWFHGTSIPTDISMSRLVEVTKNKMLPVEWRSWLQKRP